MCWQMKEVYQIIFKLTSSGYATTIGYTKKGGLGLARRWLLTGFTIIPYQPSPWYARWGPFGGILQHYLIKWWREETFVSRTIWLMYNCPSGVPNYWVSPWLTLRIFSWCLPGGTLSQSWKKSDFTFELFQSHLVGKIVNHVGLTLSVSLKWREIPAGKSFLHKDEYSIGIKCVWNYGSEVVMLSYVQVSTRPEIYTAIK